MVGLRPNTPGQIKRKHTLWFVGLPLRRSALSMHGRSSWIRELVWIISTAQAADMAVVSSPPTSSHAAMQSRDLTRFPPASSEYRTASWIVRGFKSGKETSRAAFTDSALPIIYDLKSKVELLRFLSGGIMSPLREVRADERDKTVRFGRLLRRIWSCIVFLWIG